MLLGRNECTISMKAQPFRVALIIIRKLSQEVQELDWFYKSYEWPAKIAKVMKEASSKAAIDHKSFEQSLKARRKEFGDSLGDLENRVANFSQYDVIARRAELATEVCSVFCLVL
jgi:hypothetical protein